MLIIFLFVICSFIYAINDYDNIYSIKSNPRNIAIGNLHIPANTINNIFDSPISISNDNNLFVSLNTLTDNVKIFHLAYCLKASNNMNFSFGLVRREINNNYNTNSAWIDDGYPDLSEINYNMIYKFSDKETGFLISFNKIYNNLLFGINIKPLYHTVGQSSAIGFQMDVRYVLDYDNFDISFGIDNLLSRKKWNNGLIENFNIEGYLSSAFYLSDKLTLFCEIDSYKDFGFGSEIKFVNNLSIRSGIFNSSFTFGLGMQFHNLDIDYSYLDNNPNLFGNNHIIGFIIKLNNF